MRRVLLPLLLAAGPAIAGPAVIEQVEARQQGETWSFSVTIRHGDTGWDHYADGWSVNAPDGTELGYRELLHPHENEQPFTRSLSGVSVPDSVNEVVIRAHDSVHGWSDQVYTLNLR
ncbi:MAG: hypothetical protein AAGA12_12545 [Pseudomonadota bacterium]